MASEEPQMTGPKPFVFVLMPFSQEFDDIYAFGIKGAAEEIGVQAERVDKQMFDEGILDRILSQIKKADVLVADMTGRNPNVFYEVGHAHALNKVVVLLTNHADDIPFDLKHRPHIIYGGRIQELRARLSERLKWGINEARQRNLQEGAQDCLDVSLTDVHLPEFSSSDAVPVLQLDEPGDRWFTLSFQVRNRVNLDLWYPVPPTTGGHSSGKFTVQRSPDPPHGGAGFDESHRGRVSAAGPAL